MARIRSKGGSATLLARDDDAVPMSIMPWGKVHHLAPTEVAAARNTTAISEHCGVVSIICIGGSAHFKQGDSTVVATTSDPYRRRPDCDSPRRQLERRQSAVIPA